MLAVCTGEGPALNLRKRRFRAASRDGNKKGRQQALDKTRDDLDAIRAAESRQARS